MLVLLKLSSVDIEADPKIFIYFLPASIIAGVICAPVGWIKFLMASYAVALPIKMLHCCEH